MINNCNEVFLNSLGFYSFFSPIALENEVEDGNEFMAPWMGELNSSQTPSPLEKVA